MRRQALKIPVTKDVCVFCLARMQFASVHALRRPQRRLLSSTSALYRPPANEVAKQEEDGVQGSDSAWRPQPPRPFGGGWARSRTAAPSDLTPEEVALKNVLQKESIRDSPVSKTASLQDREDANSQGQIIRKDTVRARVPHTVGQTEFPEEARLSSPSIRKIGRSPDYAIAEVSQMAPTVESVERNNGSRTLESRPITPTPTRPVAHTPQRPRFGGWAKTDTNIELTPDEKALRQTLQKEASPEPPLPVHRISSSPQTSSVPGGPSSPDPQPKDATSAETAHTSPTQTSSTQRQGPDENRNQSRLSDYRQDRDAQLDHHISQSREKPAFQRGYWHCPSCTRHNHPQHRKCPQCQTDRAVSLKWQCEECGQSNPPGHSFCGGCGTSGRSPVAQNQLVDAKNWKHVRRLGSDTSSEHPSSKQSVTPRPSGDIQALTRAKAIEQEKVERLERTKGGDFVGLRGQYETLSSKAMNASYWSLETDGSQVADSESNTFNTPETSSTKSVLVNWRAQSTKKPQVHEAQGTGDKKSGQEVADQVLEDRPRTGKLTGSWKRWEPSTAREQLPLTESSLPSPSNQNDASSYPLSTEPERRPNAREFDVSSRKKERHAVREPLEQGIAKQLIYNTPMPYVGRSDRDRIRRSKQVDSAYDDVDEEEDRAARRLERKEQRKKAKATKKALAPPTPICLPEFISVSNLAGVLRVRVEDFIRKMKDLGFEETNNDHILDAETAGLVATEFNFEPIFEQAENPDLLPRPPAEDKSSLPPRPPVVTIMGHVDHGKTTLLDYLRKSSVAASEHGGITQHIGAFSVPMPGGRLVTFLDTPGHEAFLSMRQRGANVTDIVILVVAADDSVKPQTVEAIRHAQTAKVPMIVAVNKIDKEDSNVERVKQDLARYGVEIEDYGGDTQVVCVSGKTGQGMEELEDAAVALADILDMRSETDGQAEGWVLEATTKKAGRVATVLVRRGTLRPGDIIVAGTSWARVRSLRNEAGVMLASAGPGTPVEIDGWREQPAAGDEVLQAPDEQRAKAVISHRLEAYERTQMATDMTAVNEARRLEQEKREQSERAAELAKNTPDTAATGAEEQTPPSTPSFHQVFFIIKADVSGSVEAVTNAVSALGNSEVRPHILRTGVGPVTEFDIDHAAVANGHIISFNTTVDGNILRAAEAQKVKILDQSIIYKLVDDVKAKLSEMLPDVVTRKVLGEAEVARVFEINIKGRVTVPVAGCRVRNGVIGRTGKVRVLRGKEVVYDGTLSSLKNVKKDVAEMRKGTECGMGFENWTAFKQGDQVQSYEETAEKRTL